MGSLRGIGDCGYGVMVDALVTLVIAAAEPGAKKVSTRRRVFLGAQGRGPGSGGGACLRYCVALGCWCVCVSVGIMRSA